MTDTVIRNDDTSSINHSSLYPRIGLLLDGEWVYDRPSYYTVINPSDESVLGEIPKASPEDMDRALDGAERAYQIWRKTPPAERASVLRKAARLLRERTEEIANVISLEQGKRLQDSRREVDRSATFIEWDAEQLLRTYGKVIPSVPNMQLYTVKEPIGPVAAFTPWNVPLSSPSRKISGSLAAGCSVIIKPAKETPATVCLFARCFVDAGVPKGAVSVVFGQANEVSTKLIGSPVIQMVTLTGSVGVGKQLTKLAAEGMKPVLMELGGHAPVVIDEDVDPVHVARLAVAAKFRMAGQLCVSPSRFLIHRRVYDAFVEEFAKGASALKVGDGFADGVDMGPMINQQRVHAIDALVQEAVSRGARVANGGQRVGNTGCFYAPTVLADVSLDAEAMTEEPFGPLALCTPVDDLSEAVAIANSLTVGLASYAFTNSLERASYLSRELQSGSVAINNFGSPGADAPFGGMKESGIGTEGGEESLDSYQVTKTVLMSSTKV